jgi:hypothetical protein
MIQDQRLESAVSGLLQRSERQQDLQKLVESFVDVGILTQLSNRNNQIVFGRRGTGKTHILKVLAAQLEKSPENLCVYLDARTLGSTSQFSDGSLPMRQRCLALFRDVMGEVYNAILDHIANYPTDSTEAALNSLNELEETLFRPQTKYLPSGVSERTTARTAKESSAEISATQRNGVAASMRRVADSMKEDEVERTFQVREDDKIIFPDLHSILEKVLRESKAQLFVLMDEWSSIPLDIQPYLAEFLKKSLLPLADVVVKIASLEYRSNFGTQSGRGLIGFEAGADVSASLDIDDYYVYDRNPERITDAFADMLYKHLRSELPPEYDPLGSGKALASKVFTERATFQELVRASEGVARDLINIFTNAYFAAVRKGAQKIERAEVLEASRHWFEADKVQNLDDTLRTALQRIVDEVIGSKRARSFLLPRELEKHPVVQRLFDLRILHLMRRGYADKDNPGVRYNIYTLDYGTYVDLMNTSKKPEIGLFSGNEGVPSDFVVPFDDKRSIRRIVLSADILR